MDAKKPTNEHGNDIPPLKHQKRTFEEVVLIVDNYLVEGEYWLQNTSIMLELLFPHHIYVDKIANTISRRYT